MLLIQHSALSIILSDYNPGAAGDEGESMRRALRAAAWVITALVWGGAVEAQEYRGFWVDTFNTALNNHADVAAVVNNARLANANAVFVQIRRRGDAWYLDSLESLPDFLPIPPGFDPLADLLAEAHAGGIEVHALVIMADIWSKNPNFLPSATLGPPLDPNHVFNRHGGYDPVTKTIVPGPDNWLTRTLLPDGAAGISFQGHRFASDFWLDFGHPEAAAYTVDVLTRLVERYPIDGLHLDRIRYPDISIAGQTPSTGTNVGYNPTSIARFQRHHGIAPGTPPPATNNADWSQWRRDQVSNVVRRVYLDALAIRPRLVISGSLIAFGGGPPGNVWTNAEAYWRVYQDWRAWTEEGIIDLAIPMAYKREHTAAERAQFDQWLEWTRNHQYNRAALIGQGVFLNAIEGSLRQARRARGASSLGNTQPGIVFFSMATSNAALTANPFSIPAGQNTPVRPFTEFASALTAGHSVSGAVNYEDPVANPVPLFAVPATVPALAWKTNPRVGHLKGFVKDEAGMAIDTGAVSIERLDDGTVPPAGRSAVLTASDGGGFYGGVDLAPGTYHVTVTPTRGDAFTYACTARVAAGGVSTLDVRIDRDAPSSTVAADPSELWPPNGNDATVTLSGTAIDEGTGVAGVTFQVIDEYGEAQPAIPAVLGSGEASLDWTRQVSLPVSRRGEDRDGRTYTIVATVSDKACNTRVVSATVLVPHDRRHEGGH
jgi:uncharacterized lipoprotein YddW (UPF0748 family)